jgi:hypothetical protein
MKPSQVSNQLRKIAAAIENSKKPSRRLIAKNIENVILAMNGTGNIIVHFGPDETFVTAFQSKELSPTSGDHAIVTLPYGDVIIVAKDIDALKRNTEMTDDLKEALYNSGLIDVDDEGNFLI